MTFKAMRASNYDPNKIKFPVWAQPKIDGVRALNMTGELTGRSLKKHKNRFTTAFFSKPEYLGFDGELAAQDDRHPDLCRLTSSAVGTINGSPFILWHLFDYITNETINRPYKDRYRLLTLRYAELKSQGLDGYLRIVPTTICNNLEELMAVHEKHMEQGYEGTCFRDPDGLHKQGRSSPTQGGLLRIKDFVDGEAEVLSIVEGDTNNNIPQTNELGRTFRTSHQENKVPNGMVGNLQCRSLTDIFDLHNDSLLLIPKDSVFTVSPGKMTHDERKFFFENQNQLIGKIIKHKFFPKGIKDKPRFANYVCIRNAEDMGG